jgi:hypothetical protein
MKYLKMLECILYETYKVDDNIGIKSCVATASDVVILLVLSLELAIVVV